MKCEVAKDVFWVGAVDWNVRNFHGYTFNTSRGTTYNSYLILDDKVTLVDAVHGQFADELLERISAIIPVQKIDYIIANHVESDHSGALPKLMQAAPQAKIFGTQKCRQGLYRHYYADWDFQEVRTGDKLPLGKKTLSFIEAPMLHWPDSMFSYLGEGEVLFSNDAFGQHLADCKRFDDEVDNAVLMDEARKYYANILWPLSQLVSKKLQELSNSGLKVTTIAPSHGVIWRSCPQDILQAYSRWSGNHSGYKAVLVYETMWGATERMAQAIASGLIDSGAQVKIFDINRSEQTEIIGEMLEAKGYLLGSSTHDNGMLPQIAGFMQFQKGLRPKDRLAAVFGSYGWAGGAQKEIEEVLLSSGIPLAQEGISFQYKPSAQDLKACYRFGVEFAQKIAK